MTHPPSPPLQWHPRPPTLDDIPALTALALAAKAHWGYPPAWMDLWHDELAYSDARLLAEDHIVASGDDRACLGVVSFAPSEGTTWEIEGLWIHPSAMGQGIGRGLMTLALRAMAEKGAEGVHIASDPGAKGFYEGLGAIQIGDVPSRPEGRRLPLLFLGVPTEAPMPPLERG